MVSLRKLFLAVAATALVTIAPAVRAADVVNGWSALGTITKVYSVWSFTYFKLSSTVNGCGHADFWALTTQDTSASKAKLAILLTAFSTGKTVSLRCESSQLTDFEINN